MIRVLSIDGGGVLGIIPAMILSALEDKIQHKTNNPNARLIEYLDFLSGTSTGGIIVSILNCPTSATDPTPRFSTKDVIRFYKENGSLIFELGWIKKILSSVGLSDEKYDVENLEKLLEDNFGDIWLSDMLKPCLIPAYNLEMGRTYFFCRQDHEEAKKPYSDFKIKDVCRATSAAPSYFEPALIRNASESAYPFLDGGVFANNPTMCAIAEITKADGNFSPKDMLLFSLGTGHVQKSYDFNRFRRSLAISIIPDIINIMMTGVAETTHYTVKSLFSSLGVAKNYYRFDPELANAKMAELDNAAPENLEKVMAITDFLISERDDELDTLASRLIAEGAQSTRHVRMVGEPLDKAQKLTFSSKKGA